MSEEENITEDPKVVELAVRVLEFMDENGYQNIKVDCPDEYEGGEIDVCIDEDGWEHLYWDNADDFLFGTDSVFDRVKKYQYHNKEEYSLFADNLAALGEISNDSVESIEKDLDEKLDDGQIEKLKSDFYEYRHKLDYIKEELREYGVDPDSL